MRQTSIQHRKTSVTIKTGHFPAPVYPHVSELAWTADLMSSCNRHQFSLQALPEVKPISRRAKLGVASGHSVDIIGHAKHASCV